MQDRLMDFCWLFPFNQRLYLPPGEVVEPQRHRHRDRQSVDARLPAAMADQSFRTNPPIILWTSSANSIRLRLAYSSGSSPSESQLNESAVCFSFDNDT